MYYRLITSNTNWKCPKTGTYKIIAVGKGGDGGSNSVGCAGKLAEAVTDITKDTSVSCSFSSGVSFGSIVTAADGASEPVPFGQSIAPYAAGGEGGYTPDGVYGGVGAAFGPGISGMAGLNATKNGGFPGSTGFGYGAGGGCTNTGTALQHTSGSGGCIVVIGM